MDRIGRGKEQNTFPSSCKLIFCSPKINECLVMFGVALETNDSDLIPRFCSYHFAVEGMDLTVKTRWSRDLILAAGVVDAILLDHEESII